MSLRDITKNKETLSVWKNETKNLISFSSSASQKTSRLLFQLIMSNLRVCYLRHECMFNEECQVVLPEAVIVQPDMTYFMPLIVMNLVLSFLAFLLLLIERWVAKE